MDTNNPKALRQLGRADTFAAYVGIKVIHSSPDLGIATMELTPEQRNGMGTAHGGVLFTLADMAFAATVYPRGVYWVNAQTSITYLTPGRKAPLRAESRPVRVGKSTATFEVRVLDSADTLVAIALITGHNTRVPIPDPPEEQTR